MNWCQTINSLNLDDHCSLDKKIQTVSTIQFFLVINYGQWLLLFHRQTTLCKLESQACLIS